MVFTIPEVANMFKVSEMSIRRMIDRKQLNAIKVGGQWRITQEEVDRLKQGK